MHSVHHACSRALPGRTDTRRGGYGRSCRKELGLATAERRPSRHLREANDRLLPSCPAVASEGRPNGRRDMRPLVSPGLIKPEIVLAICPPSFYCSPHSGAQLLNEPSFEFRHRHPSI